MKWMESLTVRSLEDAAEGWGSLIRCRAQRAAVFASCRARCALRDLRGQGTTEYAILVGVLVVIAILAITVFRPKIQELWDAISDGINGL